VAEEKLENHAATVRDSLSRNVVVDVGARIGYLVSRFFIPPFVLAHISLAAYGLWATAFIIVSYVGVSTLGISNVYIKYVAEYSARREYQKANHLLSTGLLITIPTCLSIFALLWIGWPTVVDWLKIEPALRGDAKEVVLSVTAIFLASISLAAFHDVLVGVQQTASVQVVWIIGYLLETGLIFLLLSLGRGIRGLAEAFLIRTAVEIGLQTIITFRTLPWLRVSPSLCTREALKILLSFGGIVQLQSLLAIFLNSV
jgi:O-antigen/teichoic acid export membrane protein